MITIIIVLMIIPQSLWLEAEAVQVQTYYNITCYNITIKHIYIYICIHTSFSLSLYIYIYTHMFKSAARG